MIVVKQRMLSWPLIVGSVSFENVFGVFFSCLFLAFFVAFSSLYLSIKWIANCAQLQRKYELKSLLPKSLAQHEKLSGKSIRECVCGQRSRRRLQRRLRRVSISVASALVGCIELRLSTFPASDAKGQQRKRIGTWHSLHAACNVQLTACSMQHHSNNNNNNN